jgi:hypothetical protein
MNSVAETCFAENRDSLYSPYPYDDTLNKDILSSIHIETRSKTNISKIKMDRAKLAGVYNIISKNRYANFTQISFRMGKTKINELEARKTKMIKNP